MAFELLSDENREILYSPYCLPIHQKFLVPGSRSYAAIGSFGSMLFQELEGSDFQIHYSNYLLKERAAFKARSEYALVELQFCMHSDEFYNLSGIGEVSMKKYHYNITYIPFTENRVSFSNRRYCTFDVHYSLDFLHRLSPHFPLLSAFLEKIDHQVAAQICPQANPATGDMLAIIRSVLQCRLEGPMKTLFLESKVKELLIRALEQYNFPAPAPALNLRPYEVEQIRQARELLMQGMEEPLTIKELSRKVGINDYKLKKGFKQVFGTTLYGEFREERMKKALQLLQDTDQSIGEIAFSTGYKSLSNFSIAFRRRFGYAPSYFRKKP